MSTRPHRRDRRVVVPATKGGKVDNLSTYRTDTTTGLRTVEIRLEAFNGNWARQGTIDLVLPEKASISVQGIYHVTSGIGALASSASILANGKISVTIAMDIANGDSLVIFPFHPDLVTPEGIVFAGARFSISALV